MGAQASAFLILKNIPEREWSFPIDNQRRVVGRSAKADIVIDSRYRSVSRQHAVVWSDRRGVWISDTGSRSGTHINGVWIDHVPRAGVEIGDTIWLGGVELEVVAEIDEMSLFVSDPADGAPTAHCRRVLMGRDLAHRLSPAEIDVMLWLSRGYQADEEIGRALHRSPNTVRTEIGGIFRKLGLHSRAELMGWVKRSNYESIDELKKSREPRKRGAS